MQPMPHHDRLLRDRAAPSLAIQEPHRIRIYSMERKADGKTYVGRTAVPMTERLRAHVRQALRRTARSAPGSLSSAIRQTLLCRFRLEEAFHWRILAECLDAAEARTVQGEWIERLGAWQPHGFNALPTRAPGFGGPVVVHRPSQGAATFPSLADAIAFRNRDRRRAGRPLLLRGTVHARLLALWSLEEALEYTCRGGPPQQRPFLDRGYVLHRLREVTVAIGLPLETVRARVHRAAGAGLAAPGLAGEEAGNGEA